MTISDLGYVTAPLAAVPPACPPTEWVPALVQYLNAHQTTAIVVVVSLLGIFAVAAVLFAVLKGGGSSVLSDFFNRKADEALTKKLDDATEGEAAAKELSASLISQLELLRLVAILAAVSIQRMNDWPGDGDHEQYQNDALVYLCDWTARIFSFQQPDICKVTIWRPTADEKLEVWYYNGMSPEAAKTLLLPISPQDPKQDTFAAVAFRSGNPEVCHDAGTDPRYNRLAKPPAHEYASILAVPVKRVGVTVGVLTVDSLFKDSFKESDQVQKAEICASLCGQFWEIPVGKKA